MRQWNENDHDAPETLRGHRVEQFSYYIHRLNGRAVITFEPGERTTDPERELKDIILPFPLR